MLWVQKHGEKQNRGLDPDEQCLWATVDYIKHKAFPRSLMKSKCRYGGDVHRLTDVARQSYVFKNVAAMEKGLNFFNEKDQEQHRLEHVPLKDRNAQCKTKHFGHVKWQLVRVKNRFAHKSGADRGYRDLLVNIMIKGFGPVDSKIEKMMTQRKTTSGTYQNRVVEMQFHLAYFKELKNDPTHFGHDIFKAWRIFDEGMQCLDGTWKGCAERCPCDSNHCSTWLGPYGIDWAAGTWNPKTETWSKVRRALEDPLVQKSLKKTCKTNAIPNEANGKSWTPKLFEKCANTGTSKALSQESFHYFNASPSQIRNAKTLAQYTFDGCKKWIICK